MTKQQIAKDLYNIDWVAVQVDNPFDNEKVLQLLKEIEKLPHKEGLRLILHVLEVKYIFSHYPITENYSPFKGMDEFSHIEHYTKHFPTEEAE